MIRFIPQRDEKERSITIPTAVQEGTSVWLTRRDYEKISEGLDRTAQELKQQGDPRVHACTSSALRIHASGGVCSLPSCPAVGRRTTPDPVPA